MENQQILENKSWDVLKESNILESKYRERTQEWFPWVSESFTSSQRCKKYLATKVKSYHFIVLHDVFPDCRAINPGHKVLEWPVYQERRVLHNLGSHPYMALLYEFCCFFQVLRHFVWKSLLYLETAYVISPNTL